MKIFTANQQPIVKRTGKTYRGFINKLMRDRWGVVPTWEVDKKAPPVYAWVNQSSWAADCECRGSCVVEPGEPYICPDCGNAMWGGKARLVIWPKKRAEIEELLLKRPFPKNRNWLVTETVADLKKQNTENGV